jgi:hypothetical protein
MWKKFKYCIPVVSNSVIANRICSNYTDCFTKPSGICTNKIPPSNKEELNGLLLELSGITSQNKYYNYSNFL